MRTSWKQFIAVGAVSLILSPATAQEAEPQEWDAGADGAILPCAGDFCCDAGSLVGCDGSLFDCGGRDGFLESLGIDVSGFLWQTVNTNSRNPRNPAAGVGNHPGAGWIYRNDEYQFNRLYLTLSRAPDTSCGQWGVGGQVDLLYGTDYVFLQSRGLETHSDFSNKWNSDTGSGFGGVD